MKSLEKFIDESLDDVEEIDKHKKFSLDDFKSWEQSNKKKFWIVYDNYLKCQFIYLPTHKMEDPFKHVGTYNEKTKIFYYNSKEITDL